METSGIGGSLKLGVRSKEISRESGLFLIADAGRAALVKEEPEIAEYMDRGGAEEVLVREGIREPVTGATLSFVANPRLWKILTIVSKSV